MLDTSVWVREPSAVLSVIHHANDRSIDENNCGCHYYYVPVPFCRLLMPTVLPDGATLLQTVNNYRTIVQDYVRDNRMLFFRCCDHVLRKKNLLKRLQPHLKCVVVVSTLLMTCSQALNTARVNTCDIHW